MAEVRTKNNVDLWLERDGVAFLKTMGLGKGHTVLDFGCGEGHYSIPASRVVGESGKVYALDKDTQPLNQLAKRIRNNNIENIEILKRKSGTSLDDNSVDVILCYDVVHYFKKRRPVYQEFLRILKPGGILSLYPKHHKNDSPLMELARMTLEDIVEEVETAGFSLLDKRLKKLIHDDYYNDGYILNFTAEKACSD